MDNQQNTNLEPHQTNAETQQTVSIPQPAMVPQNQSFSAVETIIPYRNVSALVGYYLGFLSLLPFIGALFFISAMIASNDV